MIPDSLNHLPHARLRAASMKFQLHLSILGSEDEISMARSTSCSAPLSVSGWSMSSFHNLNVRKCSQTRSFNVFRTSAAPARLSPIIAYQFRTIQSSSTCHRIMFYFLYHPFIDDLFLI